MVNGLFKTQATKNDHCVNVDAVIAVILLKIVWKDYMGGKMAENDIEKAVEERINDYYQYHGTPVFYKSKAIRGPESFLQGI